MTIELLHKELSYKLNGLAFEVFNELGPGLPERSYQKAYEELLKRDNLPYLKQVYIPLLFRKKSIRKNYADLIVEEKLLIEFKVGARFTRFNFDQINYYLQHTGIQLGLLMLFSNTGVDSRRVLNIYPRS